MAWLPVVFGQIASHPRKIGIAYVGGAKANGLANRNVGQVLIELQTVIERGTHAKNTGGYNESKVGCLALSDKGPPTRVLGVVEIAHFVAEHHQAQEFA